MCAKFRENQTTIT